MCSKIVCNQNVTTSVTVTKIYIMIFDKNVLSNWNLIWQIHNMPTLHDVLKMSISKYIHILSFWWASLLCKIYNFESEVIVPPRGEKTSFSFECYKHFLKHYLIKIQTGYPYPKTPEGSYKLKTILSQVV